jgi:manganese-dependent inorganic pyrophosphatase
MQSQIYVIGHVNPDTDSIASAMGYAWLLRERDGMDTIASRAGPAQSTDRLGLEAARSGAPFLLTDASPRFLSVTQHLDSLRPEAQLGAAWTLASRTGGVAPVVDEDGKPYGIINGFSLFKYFSENAWPATRGNHRPGDDVGPVQGRGRYDGAEVRRQRPHP